MRTSNAARIATLIFQGAVVAGVLGLLRVEETFTGRWWAAGTALLVGIVVLIRLERISK